MNRQKYLLFYFFLLLVKTSTAQILPNGFPFLQNYAPIQYDAEGQNWAILQDKRGIIYIGNNKGVLEFDGLRWKLIPAPNRTIIRSLTQDTKGKIYVGAVGEVGYLQPNAKGEMEFVSLVAKIPEKDRIFTDVWDIHPTPKGIVFATFEGIYWLENEQVKIIRPTKAGNFHTFFKVKEQFFVREWEVGLQKITPEGKLELVPNGERFAKERIYAMLPWSEGKILVATRTEGLLIFDGKTFVAFKNDIEQELKEGLIFSALQISEDLYAIATYQNGLFIINKAGEKILHLNKAAGLQDNTVHAITKDQSQNLWLALGNGISYVEINTPFTIIDARHGLQGQPLTLNSNGKNIFVAGSLGTQKFSINPKNSQDFTLEKLIDDEYYSYVLASTGTDLLLGNAEGIAQIQNDASRVILKGRVAYNILPLRKKANFCIAATQNGLLLLEKKQGNWDFITNIKGFNKSIRNLVEDEEGNIWVTDQVYGLYRLQFSDDYRQVITQNLYTIKEGLPNNALNYPFWINGKLLVGTQGGLYVWQNGKFTPALQFNQYLKELSAKPIRLVKEDTQGNLWFIIDSKVAVLYKTKNGYTFDNQRFKRLQEVKNIIPFANGTVFFLTNEGIIVYNTENAFKSLNNAKNEKFTTIIRKVSEDKSGIDTVFFNGNFVDAQGNIRLIQNKVDILKLPYHLNSLRFEFASNDYAGEVEYQYFLEGFDNEWSAWSKESLKEYTNLKEGKYVFRVRARNIYGEVSQEATYKFQILPPPQRSLEAYILYFIIGIFALWLLIRFNTWRIRLQTEKLERKVQERTLEIEKQQRKSEAQNQILEKLRNTLEGLLKESQEKNELLMSQEEELRQNMEELQTTQEEMIRTQIELESQMNALDNSPIAKAEISLDGTILSANESFLKLFGYQKDEIKDKKHQIFTELEQEDPQKYKQFLERLKTNQLPPKEYLRKNHQGDIFWVNTTYFPVKNKLGEVQKIIQLAIDITESKQQAEEIFKKELALERKVEELEKTQKELERKSELIERQKVEIEFALQEQTEKNEQLRAQEEEMRQNMEELLAMQEKAYKVQIELEGQLQAIENSTIAKAEFDMNGYLMTANKTFCKLLKYETEEIIGVHHKIFIDAAFADSYEYEFFWEMLQQGSPQPGEYKRFTKDGKEVWLNTVYSPVKDANGKVKKIIKLGFDITESKNLFREITQQTEIMRAQEEEMRQNMEELVATQEAMEQKQHELLLSQQEVEERNRKLASNEDVLKRAYANLKTKEKELKENNEILRTQEEELRQNMEELVATQEAMLQKQTELEEAKKSLEKQNKKLAANDSILKKAFEKMKQQEVQLRQNYEELQAQEEEIRQNMEELQATQEALREQNKKIEGKNRLITASIHYAQNIQQAVLPSEENLRSLFQDAFIIFKPKDIVSGDFYWFNVLQDQILLAVVDCTGHGVPGAFMSVIGNSLLNDITGTRHIIEPYQILEQLHIGIRTRLKQEETGNHDGMDICLCSIQYQNSQHIEVKFAGAKRPLYYFNKQAGELHVLKGDRKSVGGWQHETYRDFSQQSVLLKTGDALYLSTDGYADNPNADRTKFGEKALKELIIQSAKQSKQTQKNILEKAIQRHQGTSEQRDDITLVGITL